MMTMMSVTMMMLMMMLMMMMMMTLLMMMLMTMMMMLMMFVLVKVRMSLGHPDMWFSGSHFPEMEDDNEKPIEFGFQTTFKQ